MRFHRQQFRVRFRSCCVIGPTERLTAKRWSRLAAHALRLLRDASASVVLGPGRKLPSGSARSTLIAADAVAEVFYTSGTTGSPKGVVITQQALLTSARNVVTVLDLPDTGVRSLIAVPLFHVMATNNQLLPSLYVGGTAVVLPSFDPSSFALALAREQIQAVTAVPAIYWALLNDGIIDHVDTSRVRWVCYGAAATHGEQLARLAAAFPQAALSTGYGMTETTGGVTSLPHELALSAPTSIGRPMPGVELALADVDPVTGTGELLVRSAQVMAGYWQLPAETAAVLQDGWLHTGDVARVDDDGLYYIVDRLRDIINRGGEKVFCPEVEGVLAGHPDVDEVAVLGVPDPSLVHSPTTRFLSSSGSVISHCRETPQERCSSPTCRHAPVGEGPQAHETR
jgi:long-chain acyl-CoA synthetase